MKQYLELLRDVLENGSPRTNRTGIDSVSVFGRMLKFDLGEGFPIVTTRKCSFKTAFEETMFFLRGKTQTKELDIGIWKENTSREFLDSRGLNHLEEGDMGKGYGHQIRNFASSGFDQLEHLLEGLKNDPTSRRHVISHWCPHELSETALPPCHVMHFYSIESNKLNSSFVMRSSDAYLGLPFNIMGFAFINILFSHFLNLEPGTLTWFGHDVHLYVNQLDSVKIQLERDPLKLPRLKIEKPVTSLRDLLSLTFQDLKLENYQHYPPLKVQMAI